MALKIWNIGTANKRIEELEAENATLKGKISQAESAVGENNSEAVKAAEGLQDSLDTANKSLAQAQSDLATAKASVASKAAEIESLKSKLAAKDEEVKTAAARQALNIQAALGQPSAPVVPDNAKPGADSGKPKTGIARIIAAAKADLQKAGYEPRK